jgi:hypothetical protein
MLVTGRLTQIIVLMAVALEWEAKAVILQTQLLLVMAEIMTSMLVAHHHLFAVQIRQLPQEMLLVPLVTMEQLGVQLLQPHGFY